MTLSSPFATLLDAVPSRSTLREAITAQTRPPEMARVRALATEAAIPADLAPTVSQTAYKLVKALRDAGTRGIVQGLVQEYDLSTQEGVALMCLAEALLRIPDTATRDALIRDKIGQGNWRGHVGDDSSLFVNAATWGLVVSGKLLSSAQPQGTKEGLAGSLSKLIARCGEPVIRRGVDMAMRLMGEQFVTGQTIDSALKNSRRLNAKGFRYSYDMLGEAATTAADADRYYRDYETAIHAIGKASAGAGVYRGPGISVKLSALHPRYARLQRERVMTELLPRLTALARLACQYDIGFNIDAEEVDRLEISLDLLEALCFDPKLANWKGIGFVVQAYQKRAPFVLDWVIDLARRSGQRLMVRLVKGAYWDSEIKRAQVEGLSDFPVFTTKAHTDISYIACAKKLLAAPDAIFPQFATHNAQTLASIYALAGPDFTVESYEFQCLHGMGESLYKEVVGPDKLDRPVRVYAPVGTHETLLAYLVRRLLENGANSSFVNRIQDEAVTIEELIADPVTTLKTHDVPSSIRLPADLFQPERVNSAGLDLTDENTLRELAKNLAVPAPRLGETGEPVLNPADHSDVVGHVTFATPTEVTQAVARAQSAFAGWSARTPQERGALLAAAADRLEAETPYLLGIIVREAGKTFANAVAEVREAVDFLRYYGAQVSNTFSNDTHRPLGPVVCISPWNFPLAIFLGQVAAALAAGNTVLAKPAEETPLIASEAVRILHEAGIPANAVQIVIGAGAVGAALVGDKAVRGVMFTGSTEVARLIQAQLAGRLNPDGQPVPLIAETGGQNALIVDSSALAEQVVGDVLSSAFDSAGQRCSALRVLCLQNDCADRVLTMLKGAMEELAVGNPTQLATDIGPVITAEAQSLINGHIDALRKQGYSVHQTAMPEACAQGTFVPPTLIEIGGIAALKREVFGPVLHVVRYARQDLNALMDAINATGYALTFGVHSRIDETINAVTARSHAGNIYVNRNLVGAVVGVQPFGGHDLSGTGPKAGGPLYLRRLLSACPALSAPLAAPLPTLVHRYRIWLQTTQPDLKLDTATSPLGVSLTLPGPVGEDNVYSLTPRGTVLCAGPTPEALYRQIDTALATGNAVKAPAALLRTLPPLPVDLAALISAFNEGDRIDTAIMDASASEQERLELGERLATRPGQIVSLNVSRPDGSYALEWLVLERACSTNTTAAGGNAALMATQS
ncbi:trifunctional transcriptional regulator/proline dehydrogenase/L-glutamate gamma-semialdehyde dehydrogenase [Acetobacter sp. TBRC 12305]|uniref:Bifunctional protein PutA n=1 Tax=Acetobacter garciniae TaxID=2817435 RepID=A0A939HQA2_9PROT|nr:trifunctional transcriptional regulator/proline dehydrogenase/L-glutamate gamma-semialdehyde dehydrogenase [Acetobacter garciniae]MBO1325456.1 trifunctional transcriptional regulator/proline dehydrogenase/L-glutamate gamma-semialdehyde dehydrogenase [Acetobacter garciniae]MBX0345372.1 trifunctional transcriptional regulator/proline dehydrogenase/L-glutamate gamma-semialdehyde dehydrogenase [Acetobacter garciniae]